MEKQPQAENTTSLEDIKEHTSVDDECELCVGTAHHAIDSEEAFQALLMQLGVKPHSNVEE